MFDLKIRSTLIISLKNYYSEFYFIVNNGNEYSSLIKTTYGVKQGGNISPDLYKLYSETLATEIERLNVGVKIGRRLISVLMYADDVILLASNPKGTQLLLDSVTKFGYDFQVKFNPDKTNVMIETSRNEWKSTTFKLCGKDIVQSTQIKYLGNEITSNGKARPHIEKRKTKSLAALGNLRSNGILNPEMETKHKVELFNIYVKPLIYYGTETFELNGGDLELIEKTEGKLLKSIMSVPNKCHSNLLYSALKLNTPNETLEINQLKFLQRALKNEFVLEIIKDLLSLDTVTNVIGKIKTKWPNGLTYSPENLEFYITRELEFLNQKTIDRFRYNKEVDDLLIILSYTNPKYRSYKLTQKLYYDTTRLHNN